VPIEVLSAKAPTSDPIFRVTNTATTTYASGSYVGGQIRLNYTNATGRYSGVNFSNTGATSQEFFGVVQEAGGLGAFVWQGFNGSGFAERATLGSNGNLTLNSGNIVIGTAGQGIDFSASTHAAGMTSELLNDYEEGTWTPAVTTSVGSITTITTSGKYTKVGRNVTLTFRLVITDNGTGSGSFNMTGVPFAPSAPDAEAGIGRETGAVGFSCVCSFTSGTTVNLANYLGAYPGGTGYVLVGSFTYLV
jgi:hypothetical protein